MVDVWFVAEDYVCIREINNNISPPSFPWKNMLYFYVNLKWNIKIWIYINMVMTLKVLVCEISSMVKNNREESSYEGNSVM